MQKFIISTAKQLVFVFTLLLIACTLPTEAPLETAQATQVVAKVAPTESVPTPTTVPTKTAQPTEAAPTPAPTETPTETSQPTEADAMPSSDLLDEAGDPLPLESYGVENDELFDLDDDTVDPVHEQVWERFSAVIPLELRPEILYFEPIDGNSGVDGMVYPSEYDPYIWTVQLDVMESVSQKDLERTMIHEFAHLLTLRPAQIPPFDPMLDQEAYDAAYEDARASCGLYFQPEGCPTEDAYLTAFIDLFWTDLIPDDIDKFVSTDDEGDWRFEEYPDRFVTWYAATQPSEDIAESFAEYVLADTLSTENTEAAAKIRFFDDYPELQQIREMIRSADPS